MKYIRTKEGIFDKIDESLVLASLPPKYELKKNGVFVKYEFCSNCQLADTIEELCDVEVEFNHRYNQGKKPIALRQPCNCKHCHEERLACLKRGDNWFGAIWTEWGLKYVAKMNEKGTLELL